MDDSIMNGDAVSDKMEPDNQESSSKADGPVVSSDSNNDLSIFSQFGSV